MTTGETRRRPGGARPDGPLLERAQIVQAALTLTRRYGLDGMSMRKLGDELGVTSMAIYWYFKGKDELIDAITDHVFTLIEVPEADPARPWDERLRDLATEVHRVLIDYPGIADQIYTYQNFPPSSVPLVDYGVGTLRDAGFDEAAAAAAFNVLASLVITRSHFEAYQNLVSRQGGQPDDAILDRVQQRWSQLDESIDPDADNARSYVDHLEDVGAGADVFAHGVEVVLKGLASELAGG
jgi:TetR/AcrR family tetracycline transcriptional repressor